MASIPLRAASVIALVSIAGACGAVDQNTSRLAPGDEIDFQVSGGFAGVRQHLHITEDGQLIARDDKAGSEVRRQLDPARLAQIKAAFVAVQASERSTHRLSHRCADCIEYAVSATISNVRHQFTTSSGARPDTAYDEAIKLLSSILRETLSR